MTASPRNTDERLRSWLDTNQLDRERLCLAVMALDRRFTDVRPRQPRGGADGGRDLEALLKDGRQTWGAIGFQKSVSDSQSERTQARKKFEGDLARALEENKHLCGFVFFTNVDLTVDDENDLVVHAKTAGIEFCDIFDRERIRIVLDSPDGFALRFQYLDIALSEPEQKTFFARWGANLNALIADSFQDIEKRLNRIEFNQECQRPLEHIMFVMHLAEPVSAREMPEFRAFMVLAPSLPRPIFRRFHFAITNDDGKWSADDVRRGAALANRFWIDDPRVDDSVQEVSKGCGVRSDPLTKIACGGDFDYYLCDSPIMLGDLDDHDFTFFVNKGLVDRITTIEILANGYRLWQSSRDGLRFDEPHSEVRWPWPLTDEEQKDKWVRIMPESGRPFRFSDNTPQAWFQPHKHSE